MGGVVEQEGDTSPGAVGNEVPCKFVVKWHQIREGNRLLHDALVPEQRDGHDVLVTGPKTLDVRWEAGEILTGALERANNIVFQMSCKTVSGEGAGDTQLPNPRTYRHLQEPSPETWGFIPTPEACYAIASS